MKNVVFIGAVTLAMALGTAYAGTGKAAKATKTETDQTFVMNAAEGGLAEIELGRLASNKGSSAEVKHFGQLMVTDHTQANSAMKTFAEIKHITIANALDDKDKALYDRLSKLSGQPFDRAYMSAMVKDHRHDVTEFSRESRMGKDADIKAFATKTLTMLEGHLKMAESTDKAVIHSATTAKEGSAAKHGV